MEEILNNPMWNVLAVILPSIAIVVAVAIFIISRKRKKLAYQIISNNPVLLRKDEVEGKLEILFNKEPVKDVYLNVIKLINSGNVEIKFDDYDKPVTINFGENAKVLSTEVSDGVKTRLKIIDNGIVVYPTLLNRNDYITIKSLVSQYSGDKFSFDGRIVGVKNIEKHLESKNPIIVILVGMALYLISTLIMTITQGEDYLFLTIGAAMLGLVLIFIGMFTPKGFFMRIMSLVDRKT